MKEFAGVIFAQVEEGAQTRRGIREAIPNNQSEVKPCACTISTLLTCQM
jgi:hypothetical protein